MTTLADEVHALYGRIGELTPDDKDAAETVREAIDLLDRGEARVAEVDPATDEVVVHEWLKQAILCYFRLSAMSTTELGPFEYADRLPLKHDYERLGVRVVPGASARWGAFLDRDVVLMPSYVNIGARVGSQTMVDTWATVGSCAQIGKNCHLSGGVGIGGVLEPLQAEPVIIEDDCFIGARSEVVEGVIVEQGAVLAMGTFIGATTKIVNRDTGEIHMGRVPAYSVVVPGSLPGKKLPDGSPGPSLYCAVIVKQVDAQTRARTSINELLRE
jgi:2,3,4,5-tetrahydropyridine-2,6-dicarboxylate N-succinyltransferase